MVTLQEFRERFLGAVDAASKTRYFNFSDHFKWVPAGEWTREEDLRYLESLERKNKAWFAELGVNMRRLPGVSVPTHGRALCYRPRYFGATLEIDAPPYYGLVKLGRGRSLGCLEIGSIELHAAYPDFGKVEHERAIEILDKARGIVVVNTRKPIKEEPLPEFAHNNVQAWFSEGVTFGDFLAIDPDGGLVLPERKMYEAMMRRSVDGLAEERRVEEFAKSIDPSGALGKGLDAVFADARGKALDTVVSRMCELGPNPIFRYQFILCGRGEEFEDKGHWRYPANKYEFHPSLKLTRRRDGKYKVSVQLHTKAHTYYGRYDEGCLIENVRSSVGRVFDVAASKIA